MKIRYKYYYRLIKYVLWFLIPENKKILYYGHHNIEILKTLKPEYAVCIDKNGNYDAPCRDVYNHIDIVQSKYRDYQPEQVFDYVVLDIAIGQTDDICLLLKNVKKACARHTRIIIHQENYLWQWIFRIAIFFKLKDKEVTQNWLSAGDIKTYLNSAGFETTRIFRKTIFPVKWVFIGTLLNSLFSILPFLDFLKLDQYLIARLIKDVEIPKSLTICLTVRDEEENIEPIVKMIPKIAEQQEILFVEGLSIDDTENEVKRMIGKYPEKNIRLIKEIRNGQVHAIRKGFKEAAGDIIILFEGDGTSDPEDIRYFYDAMISGRFEFIEGSRFVYPLSTESMPFINKIGNMFFAKWFSMILNQRITDTLSGIKAIYKKDFENIHSTWGFIGINDPFGDYELLYGSAKYGLKIGEIPMRYKPRTYGKSKTKIFRHGMYLLKMAITGYTVFRKSKIN